MKNIFIIGAKGMGNYGGYETFVENLTYQKISENIKYHVACIKKDENSSEKEHNGARCFYVKVPNIGPAKAVYYDLKALSECIKYIKKNKLENSIIYILACRIGPFIGYYKRIFKKIGVTLMVNPDGHEWKRAKWSAPIKKYWKFSEKLMVKHADLLICDSKNIEKYIKEEYKKYNPKTTFIAYGADLEKSKLTDNSKELVDWYKKHDLKTKEYYLIVGRFVPENNYETMIKEFMKSTTKKDLVLISNVEKNKFYETLKEKTNFDKDKRIKFVGTVYEKELIKKIRENAYAYLHGHSVGGTNPSLIEALATTELNLLFDVGFNKEVAEDGALYWSLEDGDLAKMINESEKISTEKISEYSKKAKNRIETEYSWEYISERYTETFKKDKN